MLTFLKELFFGKSKDTAEQAPYKVETPVMAGDVAPQPVAEVKTDPVAVALDLEPMDFAASTTPVATKAPRKPRAPKTAEAKPAKKAAAKKTPAIKASKAKKAK